MTPERIKAMKGMPKDLMRATAIMAIKGVTDDLTPKDVAMPMMEMIEHVAAMNMRIKELEARLDAMDAIKRMQENGNAN